MSDDNKERIKRGVPGDVPKELIRLARKMRARGLGYGAISAKTGLAKSTVRYHVEHARVRQERAALYARNNPERKHEQACTFCGDPSHNVRTCSKKKHARAA